jgi:REP element-mobilizing transposase RayT
MGTRGSVDHVHNSIEEPTLLRNAALHAAEAHAMRDEPYVLNEPRRAVVADSFAETCAARGWALLALHVRTEHVHLVIQGATMPERIMRDLKAYASRRLSDSLGEPSGIQRWARHGSTRDLWKVESVQAAVKYVVEEQGRTMEVVEDTENVPL